MEVLFVLRRNQTNKSKPATVYCRITIDGIRAGDFSTFISVLPADWSADAQLIIKRTDEALVDNETLLAIRTDIKACFNELARQGKVISAKTVKDLFVQKKTSPVTLIKILEDHLTYKIANGLAKSSIKNETSRRKNIYQFLAENKLSHISGHEVDEYLTEELDFYLTTKLKHKPVHVIRHLRMVTESMVWAKRKKLIQINPIDDLTWKNVDNDRTPALTELDIYRMENYQFQSPALQRVCDRFLMQVYTGFNYVDLMQFNPDWNTVGNWIIKSRQKSKQEAIVPFVSKLKTLLAKYDGLPPQISNGVYNRLLKEVAVILNIRINLTSRVARRTAGQLWSDAGLSLETVSKMLGHKSIRTTERSYVEIAETRIERDLRKTGLWGFNWL